jgi:hypothetical protein
MKISNVLKILEGLKKEHGDLSVEVIQHRIDEEDLYMTGARITVARDDAGKAVSLIFLDSDTRDELDGYE